MRAAWVALLVAGCATAPPSGSVPYALTVCPGPPQMPAPLPRLRTVEMLDTHDLQATAALRAVEARRKECAETLERLVEWVQGR